MAPGAPGASMAPARAPVGQGFDSGHVSATILRKCQNQTARFCFLMNAEFTPH